MDGTAADGAGLPGSDDDDDVSLAIGVDFFESLLARDFGNGGGGVRGRGGGVEAERTGKLCCRCMTASTAGFEGEEETEEEEEEEEEWARAGR